MEWSLTGLPLPLILRPLSPLTDDELIAFSQKNQPFRIERNAKGELNIMTPVGGDGSRWEAIAIRELSYWAEDNGGEAFSSNGGFSLPDGSMLSPDAAWVSSDKWNALNAEERRSYPPLSPDFLIEILSASDSLNLLRIKMEVWMTNGVQLAWLIDPYAATITIYRPGLELRHSKNQTQSKPAHPLRVSGSPLRGSGRRSPKASLQASTCIQSACANLACFITGDLHELPSTWQ